MTGALLSASECTADVWSCSAACVCDEGWYGDGCALDPAAWAEIIALRNGMLWFAWRQWQGATRFGL